MIGGQQQTYSSDLDKDRSSTAGFVHDEDMNKRNSSLNPGSGSELTKFNNKKEISSNYCKYSFF